MTSTITRQSTDIANAIEQVGPVIERHRDQGEADRRLPPEVMAALHEAGLYRLWTPKEHGGLEVDIRTFLGAIEKISHIDASTGWIFAIGAAGSMTGGFLPEAGRREIFNGNMGTPLPGSVASVGRAVPDGDGFRLSGQWRLASGCHHAEWLGAAALIFDGDAPRMGPGGTPDIKLMCFRREDCEILDTWNPLGMRGTGSTDFRMENVYVPEYRVFSLFTAPPTVEGPLYRAGVLVLFSLALAGVLPGIARAGIDAFVEMARDKTPTMSQTTLGSRATVHAEVARAEMQLQSARAYLYETADAIMASLLEGTGVTEELEVKRRLACVNVGQACTQVVETVFALAGTTPIHAGHPLERCLRDIRTAAQHFFVSPAWLEKTGQYYFGHGLGMP